MKGSKELDRAIRNYRLATGLHCRYLSLKQEDTQQDQHGVCSSCSHFGDCRKIHLHAAYQSERCGGKYFYLCAVPLLHWSSPVIYDGMLQGALIAGPALLFEPDTYFIDQVNSMLCHPEDLISQLDSLQKISPERADSLAEFLLLSALSLSDAHTRELYSDRELFEQQSRIGEYLHGLKTMESDARSDLAYPLESEKKLINLVGEGNRYEAGILLDELFAKLLYTAGADLEIMKSRILELVVLLSRSAVEAGADAEQIFGINYYYIRNIRDINAHEQLAAWTRKILDRFVDLVFDLRSVRHTHRIIQAKRFAQKHFRERITLHDTASAVGISVPYLSTMFKLETGVSFKEYLTGLRIEDAKRLLIHTSDSLGSISFACGFEDQSYFTKVFRKSVGINPSRFRETGGRIIPPDQGRYQKNTGKHYVLKGRTSEKRQKKNQHLPQGIIRGK